MKSIEIISEKEIKVFFKNNFRGLIQNIELREYVTELMTEFINLRKFKEIFNEKPDSVRFNDLLNLKDKRTAYSSFKNIGDCYLWVCGFYPEHLSMKRKSKLGLKFYIYKGKESYNHAVNTGIELKEKGQDIRTLSQLSNNFVSLTRSIFDFRNKVNSNNIIYNIDPEIVKEIVEVMYEGQNIKKLNENPLLFLV